MSNELAAPSYGRGLGDGLICRWSSAADTEKIAALLANVHRDRADEPPNVRSQDLVRTMMSGTYPFMDAGDFAMVEDTSLPERPIVACTCLWRHRWYYGDLPIEIGRPEYVATEPAYRNRGLVRVLFAMIHARSEAQGHLLQAITGIPYFYRQFGYEFVLDLEGNRTITCSSIMERPSDEPEAYCLRPATLEDIPLLRRFYQQQRRGSLLWYEPDEAYWRWIIDYWQEPSRQEMATSLGVKGRWFMLVDQSDAAFGGIWLRTRRWDHTLRAAPMLATEGAVDRPALAQTLLRLLRRQGEQTPAVDPNAPPCSEISLELGVNHPVYDLLGEKLARRLERPYAWYVRTPDLCAFLRYITPVLETRLAQSILAGYNGELKLDLYRTGLYLRFEQGRLTQIESWRSPAYGEEAMAGAPPLTFLQLLLSYRSLEELIAFHPDVWAQERAKLLLNILFPKLHSVVFEPLE